MGKIADMLQNRELGAIPNYSKDDWIDAALCKTDTGITMSAEFLSTDWHRFHQAAKAHFAVAMNLIRELL